MGREHSYCLMGNFFPEHLHSKLNTVPDSMVTTSYRGQEQRPFLRKSSTNYSYDAPRIAGTLRCQCVQDNLWDGMKYCDHADKILSYSFRYDYDSSKCRWLRDQRFVNYSNMLLKKKIRMVAQCLLFLTKKHTENQKFYVQSTNDSLHD